METRQQVVTRLSLSRNKEECLRATYEILTKKYRGYRLKTYLLFWRIFENDVEALWVRSGFLHCTQMNFLLRRLLVDSGHFTEDEVMTRWTFVWGLSPHQYSVVYIDAGKKVYVDVWGRAYGVSYGEYAHGFNASLTCRFVENG